MEWYNGNYSVLPDVDELGKRPHIGRGDILKHKSGAIILRCPAVSFLSKFRKANVKESNSYQNYMIQNSAELRGGYYRVLDTQVHL